MPIRQLMPTRHTIRYFAVASVLVLGALRWSQKMGQGAKVYSTG